MKGFCQLRSQSGEPVLERLNTQEVSGKLTARRRRLPRALSAPGRGSRRRAAPEKAVAVAVARVSVPPRAALDCGERSCPGGRSRRGRATDQPAWPDWPLLLQGARDWRQDPV